MPIIKFDTPTGTTGNKGSCKEMVTYLEKEDAQKKMEKEFFFDHRNDMIISAEVLSSIDNNRQGLGKDEAKWYSGSISFSQEELKHVSNNPLELKKYALEFFKIVADNYNRGINIDDLNYFIKMETIRTYKGDSPEVKQGLAKQGDPKPGLNTHFHFIIGRKSIDGKKKLSPRTNHQNTVKGPVTASFDRDALIEKAEKLFDSIFSYNRPVDQTYTTFKSMKNGNQIDRNKVIESAVDLEFKLKLFLSSSMEKKIVLCKEKIAQINYKLTELQEEGNKLNLIQILTFDKAVLNGKAYFHLLNLENRIDEKGFEDIKSNELIIQGIKNSDKPLKEQSEKILDNSLNAFVQIINQELIQSFGIDKIDIVPNHKDNNGALLNCLINGASIENQSLLDSLVGEVANPEEKTERASGIDNQPLISEINNTYLNKGSKPDLFLNPNFVKQLHSHHSEQEIRIALLATKGIIKSDPNFHEIKNLNLFLISILVHWEKKYNEYPNILKLQRIRFYTDFLNSQIKGKILSKIDSEKVIKAEIESNYSGKTMAYLNAINSKIKKEDYIGADALIKQSPEDFNKTKSTKSNPSGRHTSILEKSEPLVSRSAGIIETLVDATSDILFPLSNVSADYTGEANDDDWEARKKRRKRKRGNSI